MPKRTDIQKVMIIGSGPIIIGQACEFDYSGTQACKALRKLGYEIVLVNSNPATIMTDPNIADKTYIEPLNLKSVAAIIEKERPDALLPNLGGQSGLNLCSELAKAGVLDKFKVKVIGVQVDAIERGEDRIEFKKTMNELGIDMPKSEPAYTIEEAEKIANSLGYPVVVRPAYTMGGTGGGICYNLEELRTVASRGLSASLVHQVLIEESVLGWEELELEIVRDSKNNIITVCFIENVDPMGVHTGDSYCVAPMQTVPKELQKRLQDYSYKIVEAIGVIGGTNVQFAHDRVTDRVVIIEINPRTSRSSALASKATGFPIAYVSALLAAGLTLDELPYWRDGSLEKYSPSGDYVVVKFARWAFEKFHGSQDKLGTQMRAVGEVMSIGKNYKEAFQKAIRSLECGRYGLGFVKDFNSWPLFRLMDAISIPNSERQFQIYEAFRKGAAVDDIFARTKITKYFLEQMKELVDFEQEMIAYKGKQLPNEMMIKAKKDGFADRYIAKLIESTEEAIRAQRLSLGIAEGWEAVSVSGVEDAAYYFSTYNAPDSTEPVDCEKKIMVLGGGPNRIGQGIEFDYCCVHAAFALRDLGVGSIMVNCNPETVSTDFDTSNKLYFEPLTVEDVLSIYEKEKPQGVICQFGGQTPLNIAQQLQDAGVHILGTSPHTIALAEDRDLFRKLMEKLGIPMPQSSMASTIDEALAAADKIGYPLMVRPSFVLGGRGMEIVHDEEMLRRYVAAAIDVTPERPLLIDKFLSNSIECEADAICDGTDAFVPAVMEHVELAGIHSGDSACSIPPVSIDKEHIAVIEDITRRLAIEMGVIGLLNVQYAICDGTVYVLEANPRASRTVPLVSKVCNVSMANIATKIMMGKKLKDFGLSRKPIPHFGVKESVFPFNMFQEVDPVLGPEMRSTGEVLGLCDSFGAAYFKAQEAANQPLPLKGNVLLTVNNDDKTEQLLEVARLFTANGFKLFTTTGTADFLAKNGIESKTIHKTYEGRPDIVDCIKNGDIQLLVNTPAGAKSEYDDSYIRKNAIKYHVPYITTMAGAMAAAHGIEAMLKQKHEVKCLQDYHKSL